MIKDNRTFEERIEALARAGAHLNVIMQEARAEDLRRQGFVWWESRDYTGWMKPFMDAATLAKIPEEYRPHPEVFEVSPPHGRMPEPGIRWFKTPDGIVPYDESYIGPNGERCPTLEGLRAVQREHARRTSVPNDIAKLLIYSENKVPYSLAKNPIREKI